MPRHSPRWQRSVPRPTQMRTYANAPAVRQSLPTALPAARPHHSASPSRIAAGLCHCYLSAPHDMWILAKFDTANGVSSLQRIWNITVICSAVMSRPPETRGDALIHGGPRSIWPRGGRRGRRGRGHSLAILAHSGPRRAQALHILSGKLYFPFPGQLVCSVDFPSCWGRQWLALLRSRRAATARRQAPS